MILVAKIFRDFNPRSPHGERRKDAPAHYNGRTPISIHAPRMGSDLRILANRQFLTRFQSTLPAWGATTAVYS